MASAARRPLLGLLLPVLLAGAARGWHDPGRMLLRDVKALTLHAGRYTASRRLDPVPQLKCVGGTARCDSHTPTVVQCHNRGWDGYDVQWECKADLDVAYKFGETVVSCEGYESPEDQYVLRGSCGLEYQLDYTELGLQRLRESGRRRGFASVSDAHRRWYSTDSCGAGGLVTIAVLLAVAFVVYKLFLRDGAGSPLHSEHPFSHSYPRSTSSAGPPPPGFKSEFTGAEDTGLGGAFAGRQGHDRWGPGFWTGLGTGGILGYLLGSNRAAAPSSDPWYGPARPPSYPASTWGSPAYSPAPGGLGGSQSACSDSDGRTRVASGYGGTRRR
ncbi:store-operated calcium entry-associated regulatory factor [Tupaia chinensis]|uniref:store-operated calcium entry-associated regulatory factor n=1 Tax=Tupaia chinensis TaxID=246437 RepID=UPI000703F212|nr:store-operated calcium entry-associated regulatory factor [Tupaia chinensis]XP_006167252.2 store-operated calcium entry-associated regulatory factor [Tupaia chinensis]XP_006167253.2 store-operated calcium entry-associated regulatory factor [Tupaia chinensis]XP_014439200.1 store-operated calcium entry-associated regulatory factor [Tupaia chinensis]